MIKAIYLTGLIVAAAFTLLWLLIDDMRREIREVEEGYYREKLEGKDKAALIFAEIGTSLTVGFMWWLAIIIIIGVTTLVTECECKTCFMCEYCEPEDGEEEDYDY